MNRELLQQALDALRMAQVELSGNLYAGVRSSQVQSAITALSAALAAPPAAPAPGDMVMVPLKFVQDFNTLAHNYCLRAVPPDYYSGTEADAFQHAYSRCGSDLRRLREILAAAPAPADWGTPHDVSGAPWGAPAPAVCDGGTCGLGGYCTNCPRLSAAPAVREPQYWCPETGELCGKCAKTGTCEASILQAHGIGGGGNG